MTQIRARLHETAWSVPDALASEVAARVPSLRLRMRLYAAAGVRFEDRDSSTVMMHTDVTRPMGIEVGAHTLIGRHCLLDGRGGITLGRNVNISSYVLLITGTHDFDDASFTASFAPIVAEDYAWIATRALVLPGVTIGRGAVIAAGAVVTKDVEPMTVCAGIPARPINRREGELTYRQDYRPIWA